MNFHYTRGALQLTLPGVCITVIIYGTLPAAESCPKMETPVSKYPDQPEEVEQIVA